MMILKSKKTVLVLILLIIALAAFITSLIFLKKDTNNYSVDNNLNSPVSFLDSSNSAELAKDYDFVNKDKFQIFYQKYLHPEFCAPDNFLSYPVDVTKYSYNSDGNNLETNEELGSVFVSVSKNTSTYASYDYKSIESYKQLENLFKGNTTLDNAPVMSSAYSEAFARSCTSVGPMPVGYIKSIEYPKTESAYLILRFGSYQSTTNKDYMPLTFEFVSKIGDNTAVATTQSRYSYFTKSNHLDSCETVSEYGYVYIPSDHEGKNCIIEALQKDLNYEKIDTLIQKFILLFKLK